MLADGDVSSLLRRFQSIAVAVVGDVIYDAYLDGPATRLCREGPVPVVAIADRREAAGGAANVAVNLAALGARVELFAVIGDDDAGACVLEIARRHGVGTDGVLVSSRRRTCAKLRVLAGGQILVRYDEGTETPPAPEEQQRLLRALAGGLARADAVVLSDYRAGVVTDRLIESVARHGRGVPLVVDGRDPRRFRAARPAICTPSFSEAAPLAGPSALTAADRAGVIAASAERILAETGADVAVVTLDRDGAVVLEAGRPARRVVREAVPERSSAGAGDTFTAALALAAVAGTDPMTAAVVAAAAAEVVVAKRGTATCSPAELRLRLLPDRKLIADVDGLAEVGERHRREARRIVLANGCFDILHRGHVALLHGAKREGDVLVVAVNGDDSVRRVKGPSRPVNTLADRIEVLAALHCVDHIVAFDEDQPLDVIRALRPDVLVKGGDYTEESVPEAPLVRALGGRVQILELVPEHSTTRTIERVRVPPSR
ncbi:MAG: D-glycero-beta-D-manno-heptose 1-phosphate adenylyltransferase [Conexibacter sp.]|nr:D-glycero-beta-D-manno-heptose 1-phosphate adenylyltransferase [Conexibacter sp.]